MNYSRGKIGAAALVALAVFFGFTYYNYFVSQPKEDKAKETAGPELIGGDKDEGGCLIAAGYSWCEAKGKCLRTWEEPCEEENVVKNLSEEDVTAIKSALAKNHDYETEEVHLTVSEVNGDYLRGGVKFKDDLTGGIVLAAKVNGIWEIAHEGNGMISCADMRKYDFPAGMITDCANPGSETGAGGPCPAYSVENCPAECVVCPPCEVCSSISCQSEEFCAGLGIGRTWYENMKAKQDEMAGCKDQCGNGVCEEVVCQAIGCPCAETPESCPADCAAAPGGGAGIANPASVYCEENGGKLEIKTNPDGSQAGVCNFPDKSYCDEWAYFRGECKPGDRR